ncbi:hypothetical protein DFH28DRAFT_883098 [Melampsora americana]|nr:hypothetical protein DFH28DRAFT_883098 [Melampsora americana]
MPAHQTTQHSIHQTQPPPQQQQPSSSSSSNRQEPIDQFQSSNLFINHHQSNQMVLPFDRSSFTSKSKPKRLVSRPLQRNQACSTCRSRKVRCDAARPACGACCRSAAAHGEDPSIVLCQYEIDQQNSQEGTSSDHHDQIFQTSNSENLKSKSNNTPLSIKIANLEEQIAEVEKQISEFNLTPTDQPIHQSASSNPLPPSLLGDLPLNSITPDPTSISYDLNTNASTTLLSTDWPKSLPPRPIVSKVIEIYLSQSRGDGQTMFLEGMNLQASLHLPPLDSNFPFIGLLHSIMALTLQEIEDDQLIIKEIGLDQFRYWPLNQTVFEYHAEFAKIKIDEAIEMNCNLLQAVQAMVIYSVYTYKIASLVESWVYCGLAVRFATILGLNHLEDCVAYRTGEKTRPRVLLPPPRSVTEKYQRAHSIEESDISTFLPSNQSINSINLTLEDFQTHSLSISNPNLFKLPSLIEFDEVQIELKGFILLGRVTDWLRHSPDPIGFNLKKKWKVPMSDIPDLRYQKSFIKLNEGIHDFQTSMSSILPKITNLSRKILIQLMICTSKILLHECFMINGEKEDQVSFEICWNASEVMVGIGIWLISLNGFDFNSLHS